MMICNSNFNSPCVVEKANLNSNYHANCIVCGWERAGEGRRVKEMMIWKRWKAKRMRKFTRLCWVCVKPIWVGATDSRREERHPRMRRKERWLDGASWRVGKLRRAIFKFQKKAFEDRVGYRFTTTECRIECWDKSGQCQTVHCRGEANEEDVKGELTACLKGSPTKKDGVFEVALTHTALKPNPCDYFF